MRIELDAAAERRHGLVQLVEQVVDGPEIDVGPRPQRVEAGHFAEMVRGTIKVAQLKADRCQAVMDVRGIGTKAQSLQVQLPCTIPVALIHALASALEQTFDAFGCHGSSPRLAVRGREAHALKLRSGTIITGGRWESQRQSAHAREEFLIF